MNLFELKILDFIAENLKCGFLDTVMPIITKLGDAGIFWIVIALILLITKKYRKIGAMMGVALILGLVFGNLTLKPLVARIRPYDMPGAMFSANELLVEALHDKSFPSGHTLCCFEGATVLMLNNKRFGIPALIIAILVAFSRLYLYVHYPTDVLAGIVMGVLFGIVATFGVNKIISQYTKKHSLK